MFNLIEIIIRWILNHIEVRGNERADSADKSALDMTPENFRIPYTELKHKINKVLTRKLATMLE